MEDITVILTAYRRPALLRPQVEAVRAQSRPARYLWVWANAPTQDMRAALGGLDCDRVVTCSENAFVHARFALALTARTPFVALFDDDALPGTHWFANCLRVMERTPGILGSAGVRVTDDGYHQRTLHGWHAPTDETVEVDLVGHAWFLRTEWVRHLFAAPPVLGTNGEDIELAARAWRLGGIRCFCPPHPTEDRGFWGSLHGVEHGSDTVAMSRQPAHLDERDRIVRAEVAAGWRPLCLRTASSPPAKHAAAPPTIVAAPSAEREELPAAATDQVDEVAVLLESVPPAARRILEINCGAGDLGAALKTRQQAYVVGIERDPLLAAAAQAQLDRVCIMDAQGVTAELAGENFDCIIWRCPESASAPERLLRAARTWLGPGGKLLALFPNARHHATIAALLDGSWAYAPVGAIPRRQLRFFTRREIEKLCFRAGLILELQRCLPVPAIGHPQAQTGTHEVRVGALHISGLAAADVGEFHATHCLVEASPAPEPDYGKTSIVIVTHNELACTQPCLDSIERYTDDPFEVIVIDNGSTDGTLPFLRSLPDVQVIANETNRGFPAAANQGIRAATGRQVLLLNNDTVVTTGWLRPLLQALHSDPKVGLAGPCSNCVSGLQEVDAGYEDLTHLDGFAWDFGKAFDRVRTDTDRLVGFCLLIRRELIDAIGCLDERFGIGCFDDDDYCLRAVKAGYRAVIARDAFVHHVGQQTFRACGVDYGALLRTNGALFREKWDPDLPDPSTALAPAGRPDPPQGRFGVRVAPSGGLLLVRARIHLSVCMIVRDEAPRLAACLTSLLKLGDELVIIDTGSVDDTVAIAKSFGARVFHFPWCDSFAAARNESLRHARGEWIFWIDADDTISPADAQGVRALAYGPHDPQVLGYVCNVHCPGPGDEGATSVTRVHHVKLFRNRPDVRFEGRIHEQILPSISRARGRVEPTNLVVVQSNHDYSPEGQAKKKQRDLHLLGLELADQPNHPFTLFNLGMTHADFGEYATAAEYLERSLAHSQGTETTLRKVYALLAGCYLALNQLAPAEAVIDAGLKLFPTDVELRFRRGVLLHASRRLHEAAAVYESILQGPAEPFYYQSMDQGLKGFMTRLNLAGVYADLGNVAGAEAALRLVVAEAPGFREGWRQLGNLLLTQGKLDEAEAQARQLENVPHLRATGLLLRGRLAAHRQQWDTTRRILALAVADYPDQPVSWEEYCRFLFEHGEPAETARALERFVQLEPENACTHHNLAQVYRRLGRHRDAVEACRRSLEFRPDSPATQQLLREILGGGG